MKSKKLGQELWVPKHKSENVTPKRKKKKMHSWFDGNKVYDYQVQHIQNIDMNPKIIMNVSIDLSHDKKQAISGNQR